MDVDVSIVLSTYNRSAGVVRALEALLRQSGEDLRYEVIVVDNNSTDNTRGVLDRLIAENPNKLRYVFEARQGLSYGRNAGIVNAKAGIIAFTDDDVQAASDWVYQIKTGFASHEGIEYIGGKVLPQWPGEPPAWLTRSHWAPLALLDYGDSPFFIGTDRRLCLVGANFAFRRRAFEQVGLFNTEFQRVKASVGSLEDHEMLIRLWNRNLRGLYSPKLIVTAEIERERMEKAYHRRWHRGHGHFNSVLRAEEMERSRFRILGAPAHLYRQAFTDIWGWFGAMIRRHPLEAFVCELRLRFFVGFVSNRWREYFGGKSLPAKIQLPSDHVSRTKS